MIKEQAGSNSKQENLNDNNVQKANLFSWPEDKEAQIELERK